MRWVCISVRFDAGCEGLYVQFDARGANNDTKYLYDWAYVLPSAKDSPLLHRRPNSISKSLDLITVLLLLNG